MSFCSHSYQACSSHKPKAYFALTAALVNIQIKGIFMKKKDIESDELANRICAK